MRWVMLGALVLSLSLGAEAYAAGTTAVTGSLIDTFCYTTMGAHGSSHAACALKCVKNGAPVGLLEKGSHKLYVLLPARDAAALPASVFNHMEQQVTITGNVLHSGGSTFLTVKSLK
ncbi:MAG TPA: hypothetical protein VKV28_15210 [Candidatus Binataceae bacterium]|nr:hypothetical protein [Candidatus Binataceae bacterium]